MATIYLVLSDKSEIPQYHREFKCSKCEKYHQSLWTIERKLTHVGSMAGANINKELKYIDPTVPTEVDRIPKGAFPVLKEKAEELWHLNSHYFGVPDPAPFNPSYKDNKKPARPTDAELDMKVIAKQPMQSVWIVRNKHEKRIQTAWFSRQLAEEQAEATESEMLAEDFPEEESRYEVVGEVFIQDSVVPVPDFDQKFYEQHIGPTIDKMEDAVDDFIHATGWENEDAIAYMIQIVKDRLL